MKKNTLNYWIDIIMFILMMAILGIGLLMKFVLISGQERWVRYGSNLDITFLGLDRHGWGRVHLILGLVFIGVLLLHLVLHWKSIVHFFKRAIVNTLLRIAAVSLLLLAAALLIVFPFLIRAEVSVPLVGRGYGRLSVNRWDRHAERANEEKRVPDQPGTMDQHVTPEIPAPAPGVAEEYGGGQLHRHHDLLSGMEIQGYMTLLEVSEAYQVPVNLIKEALDLPPATPENERLGRLRRLYGFTMSDVREVIRNERSRQNAEE